MYEEKLVSEVFKNGRRGLLGSQKTAHLIRLQRERGEQEGPRFRFSFSFFLARGCLCPRAHNIDDIDDVHKTLSVVAYTLHVRTEYLPTHFFFALLPSFPPASPRSINGRTENSLAPEIVSFCLSFSFHFLYSFKIIYGWRCCRSKNGRHRAQLTGQKRS